MTACLVMAAGKGTRMRSRSAKVLARVKGKPLLAHVLDSIRNLSLQKIVVIVGYDRESVKAAFADEGLTFVVQEEQLGTGHAVQMAAPALEGFDGDVLILSGDMPLVRPETLTRLMRHHRNARADFTLLTARPEDPFGLGRVVRGSRDEVLEIVEEKDIEQEAVRRIREVNLGVYMARAPRLFRALEAVGNDNAQQEYYLPDVVKVLLQEEGRVEALCGATAEEGLGVNSREELKRAEIILDRRGQGTAR